MIKHGTFFWSELNTGDVEKRLEALITAGGVILRAPFDVPDVGRIAIVQDPTGAPMGWMTPVERG